MNNTVLLVDDDEIFLMSMQHGLKSFFPSVDFLSANNGHEALKQLKEKPVDLLVTDLDMPGMSGFDLLTYMNQDYPYIPIIVITGLKNRGEYIKKYRAFQFIEKPVNFREMREVITKGLTEAVSGESRIEKIALPVFTQIINMEKMSRILVVNAKEKEEKGALWFENGELINAIYKNMTGLEAAYEILSWNRVNILVKEIPSENNVKQTITESFAIVLMEALRLKDESGKKDLLFLPTNKGKNGKAKATHKLVDTLSQDDLERVNEKIQQFHKIKDFLMAALYTEEGDLVAMVNLPVSKLSNLEDVGRPTNDIMQKAKQIIETIGAGRNNVVHIEADNMYFLAHRLKKGYLLLALKSDAHLYMAKIHINVVLESLAEDFEMFAVD